MTKGTGNTCRCTTAFQKTCTFVSCSIGTATASGIVSWVDGKLTCQQLTFDIPAIGKTQVQGESVTIGTPSAEEGTDTFKANGAVAFP